MCGAAKRFCVRCCHTRLCAAQVAWQRLLGTGSAGDGAVLEDSGAGRASVVAAVLTTRRVLLAAATLRALAAAALPPGAPAAMSLLWVGPALLWVGPALLFSTEAHQARRAPRRILLVTLQRERRPSEAQGYTT